MKRVSVKRLVGSGLLLLVLGSATLTGAVIPGPQGASTPIGISLPVAHADGCDGSNPQPDPDCPQLPTPTPTPPGG